MTPIPTIPLCCSTIALTLALLLPACRDFFLAVD